MEKEKIPNLGIDAKNRIMEETKKIPLLINGEEKMITLKKLNTGIRNKLKSECTKTTFIGGQQKISVDESELQEKILSKAIIDAPFETDVDTIKKLPSDVSDYILLEYGKFAEPNEKKN